MIVKRVLIFLIHGQLYIQNIHLSLLTVNGKDWNHIWHPLSLKRRTYLIPWYLSNIWNNSKWVRGCENLTERGGGRQHITEVCLLVQKTFILHIVRRPNQTMKQWTDRNRQSEGVPPAAKCSGVDFLPAVSRLFTFSAVTSLRTRSRSPLRQASNSSLLASPAPAAPPGSNTSATTGPVDTAPPPRPDTPEHLRPDNMRGGERPRPSFRLPVLESLECEQQEAEPQNPAATEAMQDDELRYPARRCCYIEGIVWHFWIYAYQSHVSTVNMRLQPGDG